MLFSIPASILMVVALNSGLLIYLFRVGPWPLPFLVLSFGISSSNLVFRLGLCLLLCVRKACYVSCFWEQQLFKEVIYCSGHVASGNVSGECCMHSTTVFCLLLHVPVVGSVWTLARVRWVLTRCALACFLKDIGCSFIRAKALHYSLVSRYDVWRAFVLVF